MIPRFFYFNMLRFSLQDGIHILNIGKTWEKLVLAARIIVAIENPQVRMRVSYRFCIDVEALVLAESNAIVSTLILRMRTEQNLSRGYRRQQQLSARNASPAKLRLQPTRSHSELLVCWPSVRLSPRFQITGMLRILRCCAERDPLVENRAGRRVHAGYSPNHVFCLFLGV